MENNNSIGMRMKQARQYLKLTQAEFAKKLGISRSHVSNIENNNEQPSKSLIMLVAVSTPIRLDWLENGIEPMVLFDDGINKPFDDFSAKIESYFKTFATTTNQEKYLDLLEQAHFLAEDCNIDSDSETVLYTIEMLNLIRNIIKCNNKKSLRALRNQMLDLIDELEDYKTV